jgi:peptide/nickel transport system substrate-binding protein
MHAHRLLHLLRRAGAVCTLVLIPLVTFACGGEGGGGGGGPEGGGGGRRGGTVVVGMRSDFGGFNPVTNTDQYTDELIKYALFTPLIQYDKDLKPRPWLAESWTLTGDTGVVFKLRNDVRWHDGRRVTADDVSFTFDLAKNPVTASLLASAYLADVDRAHVVDSLTIRFHFKRPHAQALEDFWWAPLPKHLLSSVVPIELRNAPYNRQPVGSGPYRFVEWRPNQQLTLQRDSMFPEGLGGPPNLERAVFRIVPEAATILTELLSGGIGVDVPLNPDQTQQVKGNPTLTLFAFPSRSLYYIGWNNQRPPFNNAAVRRAMTMAIDRQQIIDALLFGYGTPAVSTVPPWHPMSPKDIAPLAYDPAQAGLLLDQAGWTDRNGDGIRENAQGANLTFTLLVSSNSTNRSVVEVVQDHLKKVGVDAQVRVLEFQTLLAQHKARDFDAVFTTWIMDNFQLASTPAALFHSRLAKVPLSSNRSGVSIPRLDALIDRGGATTDDAKAAQVWREFTQVLNEEQPVTFMFWFHELAAASKNVSGVEMDQRGELMSIQHWALSR